MYYLLLPNLEQQSNFILHLKNIGINVVFHYVPLHSSRIGKTLSRTHGDMTQTNKLSECLVRLPLWVGLNDQINNVIYKIESTLRK